MLTGWRDLGLRTALPREGFWQARQPARRVDLRAWGRPAHLRDLDRTTIESAGGDAQAVQHAALSRSTTGRLDQAPPPAARVPHSIRRLCLRRGNCEYSVRLQVGKDRRFLTPGSARRRVSAAAARVGESQPSRVSSGGCGG